MVVTSQKLRANITALKTYLGDDEMPIIVSASKGLELKTLMRMSEVLEDELGEGYKNRFATLSGPNLAKEIIVIRPATTVIAYHDPGIAQRAQEHLSSGRFRICTKTVVWGVELAGS